MFNIYGTTLKVKSQGDRQQLPCLQSVPGFKLGSFVPPVRIVQPQLVSLVPELQPLIDFATNAFFEVD